MHSFSLPKGSPVTLDEMQKQLGRWEEAGTLLLTKRHFGKDATLKIHNQSFSTFADIRNLLRPDLPEEYLEWDMLIASAVVNPIWAARKEERLRKIAASAGNRRGSVRK